MSILSTLDRHGIRVARAAGIPLYSVISIQTEEGGPREWRLIDFLPRFLRQPHTHKGTGDELTYSDITKLRTKKKNHIRTLQQQVEILDMAADEYVERLIRHEEELKRLKEGGEGA